MPRLVRVTAGAALAAAALLPATAPAEAAQMCRIVIDPYPVWTPIGVIQVPRVYCVSP